MCASTLKNFTGAADEHRKELVEQEVLC